MAKKKSSKQIKHRPGTLERQALKRKVRNSPEWAELRQLKFKEQNGVDPITLRPLNRGFNCHHMQCEDWKKYGDLNPEYFVCLNTKTHECIHLLWDIVKREGDYDVFTRIIFYLKKMEELNGRSTE